MIYAKKGFLLSENIIAIIILGMLVALAIPNFKWIIDKSHSMEAIPILDSLRDGQVVFRAENESYSTEVGWLDLDFKPPSAYFLYPEAIETTTGICSELPGLALGQMETDVSISPGYILYILEDSTIACQPKNCSSNACQKMGYQ